LGDIESEGLSRLNPKDGGGNEFVAEVRAPRLPFAQSATRRNRDFFGTHGQGLTSSYISIILET
jgi:hypothetical protein